MQHSTFARDNDDGVAAGISDDAAEHALDQAADRDAGYAEDFVLWISRQVALLRAHRFDLLDLDNVIEELDGMNSSHHLALRHRLTCLIVHLLKSTYQPQRKSRSWRGTIVEQRARILDLLDTSPSLARRVQEYADRAYSHAVAQASAETGLAPTVFPSNNPYSVDQLLDADFIP